MVEALDRPFRPRGLLNAATLEAVMLSLIEQGAEAGFTKAAYDALLKDQDFTNAITSNTSNIDSVKSRKIIADRILFGHE